MKVLKLLIIVVIFVVNHSCSQKQDVPSGVEDQSIYYENNNQERSPVKSTIIFRNDLVFIVDSQSFPGGSVEYRVGKPKISPNSSTIECEIHKTIIYSTNIGRVVGYSKDYHETITLTNSEQGELIMTSNDGQMIMKYKKSDSKNSSFPESMTQWIEQYEGPK